METSLQAPTSATSAAIAPAPPRLLILGCSKAKTAHDGLIPAIERYDGPAFRVLRRYLRQRPDPALAVHVLSAEFGLIPADTPIPYYDRQMTTARAEALQPRIDAALDRLRNHVDAAPIDANNLLVVASNPYLSTLTAAHGGLPGHCVARGSQGKKLAALHDWLYGACPKPRRAVAPLNRPIRLRGVDVTLHRDDVLAHGEGELPAPATTLTAWAVPIDDRLVAPKWLVSRATGMPVGRFTTSDALSLLARLGIEVVRA